MWGWLSRASQGQDEDLVAHMHASPTHPGTAEPLLCCSPPGCVTRSSMP